MPYREKTAWLYLIAMAATFGPYFMIVAANPPREALPNLRQLSLYAVTAGVQMLILGVGHLYLRRVSPQEAHTPPDERDLAITRHAISSAYYVMIAGMILVGGIMPFTARGWSLVNAAIAMIAIAQIVQHGIVVLSYRRQQG
ncbi:MAG: hypothetical protein JO316_04180 [Abitibacteriaceae bacterium]|nr:hypothetical protein [Abditibacteriaceae bacterium]MBV9864522.1 hypothetical protein [Abditibacteriaceae bacterium]